MTEVRFHGRGGQGIVVGCSIVGMVYFYEDYAVQFFPEFGVERRGSPVQAFLRVSDTKIREHFSIKEPDCVVLFDRSIMDSVNVTSGLKEGGMILINSKKSPDEFGFGKKFKVATIDADAISQKYKLGNAASPIINAAMAGAYAKMVGNLNIKSLTKAISESVPVKIEENIMSAATAYEKVLIG